MPHHTVRVGVHETFATLGGMNIIGLKRADRKCFRNSKRKTTHYNANCHKTYSMDLVCVIKRRW